MTKSLALSLLLAAAPMAGAATPAAAPAPAEIVFAGDAYKFAAREVNEARIAEHYLREGETNERFSRRFTVADQLKATSAKSVALGLLGLARMRTPGIAPETFASESAPDHDISIAWYDMLDDGSAVEYHAARFVDLKGGGVREYHLTVRRYTNGQPTDAVFGPLRGQTEPITLKVMELIATLDRAPSKK